MAELPQPIADHIWLYPPNADPEATQPGVGIIVANSATVLVDAGNGPRHARQIRAALRQMDAPPVAYVLYTHHHWDHTFGAQIWRDSIVVAQAQCRPLLLERYGSQPWSRRYIQEQSFLIPARASILHALDRAVEDWGAFRLVLPQITFSSGMSLIMDNLTITLQHVGGRHAADSSVVRAGNVMFLGDCFYPAPPHLRESEDGPDLNMLQTLLEQDVSVYIDSHNGPVSRAELSQRVEQR
jgi:glyoxylase-like metal-dependent hydrolase (beta-lactamase superfamily II)